MKYINLIASMCFLSHCHVHSTADASLWGHSNKSNVVLEDLLRQNNNSWCCTLILEKLYLTFPATTGNHWFQKAKKKKKKRELKNSCNLYKTLQHLLLKNKNYQQIRFSIITEKYNFLNAKSVIWGPFKPKDKFLQEKKMYA